MEGLLEVCCDNLESVKSAIRGGATQIELCSALNCGGLTPSPPLTAVVHKICRENNVRLHVMIRACVRNTFSYSEEEWILMMKEASELKDLCDGVVFGCLLPDADLDEERVREMIALVKGRSTTFHRAFDLIPDARRTSAMAALERCGVDYVLTSGGAKTAIEGLNVLKDLNKCRKPQLICASGINANNVSMLLREGIKHVHGSFSTKGATNLIGEGQFSTSETSVRRVRELQREAAANKN